MKTKTGLFIIHKGNRVNVYTASELKAYQSQSLFQKALKNVLNTLKINI